MTPIAMVGATGAVGEAIAAELRARGRSYRAIGRSESLLHSKFGNETLAQIRTWNADAASAEQALEGTTSLIYLVGVPYDRFDLHPKLMAETIKGAIAAGVKRLLLIGTVYPYGEPVTKTVDESHPRNPTRFNGMMRKAQEDLVLSAHTESFQTVILRLPDLYGPGMEKSYLTSQFKNAPQGKRSMLLGPINVRHEWGFIPDCASVAVRVLDEPKAYGTFWNFAGPGEITQREFSDKIYAACGRKPRYVVASKAILQLMGMFDGQTRMLADMNYLMTKPVIMNDGRLRALLGRLQKTSYDDGIRATLDAQKGVSV